MKTKTTLLTAIFALTLTSSISAQNEYRDWKIQDTVKDENFTIFNMNDFRDALVQLGINVFKWNLPIPQDKDYRLIYYLQEYERGKLIKDSVLIKWDTKYWGSDDQNRAVYKYIKNLRIITEMPENDEEYFRMKFSMNNSMLQIGGKFKDRPELRPYFLMKFGDIDFEIGKDIPLILYTAGWETVMAGEEARRFCGVYNPTNINNEYIQKCVHYIVIGYRVLDEEFYGRD